MCAYFVTSWPTNLAPLGIDSRHCARFSAGRSSSDQAQQDPTWDIRTISYAAKGHHAWTLEEVEAFESFHPVGSKPGLAMALMLYTACRREDAVRLGAQHIRRGCVQFRQAKNEHRNPIEIDIPLYPDLADVIDATPSGHLTFLVRMFRSSLAATC